MSENTKSATVRAFEVAGVDLDGRFLRLIEVELPEACDEQVICEALEDELDESATIWSIDEAE